MSKALSRACRPLGNNTVSNTGLSDMFPVGKSNILLSQTMPVLKPMMQSSSVRSATDLVDDLDINTNDLDVNVNDLGIIVNDLTYNPSNGVKDLSNNGQINLVQNVDTTQLMDDPELDSIMQSVDMQQIIAPVFNISASTVVIHNHYHH